MVVRLKIITYLCILNVLEGCVEIFEFNTDNETPGVVIEGYISDVSSEDYYSEFDENRFFKVTIKYSSRAKNIRDIGVENAEVELHSITNNEYWDYTDTGEGVYRLLFNEFEALPNHEYQLKVKLPEGIEIVSDMEMMPKANVIGEINFKEAIEFQYVYVADEEVIKEVAGVDVNISIPESANVDDLYYRWNFLTTWTLKAVLIPERSPVGVCWVTENYLLDEFKLSEYKGLPLNRELFFMATNRNLPVRDGMAVRVNQMSMNAKYYQFWEDLDNQKKQEELFAPPPYNMLTNMSTSSPDLEVYGYFGVVKEHTYTWYFDLDKLSYRPIFTEPCYLEFANDRPAYCGNCLAYEGLKYGDEITNVKPKWWTF